MSKIFGKILEITDLQTVSDINNLDIKLYEAEPMLPRGWTRLFTYQNTVGYMDELERVCKLSASAKCKYLLRADGPDLYYAKLRISRQICKNCRNEAYKHKTAGKWTDKKDCLAGAWWPKAITPLRPKYGDLSVVHCPGPVVTAWMNDYMVPKIYGILIKKGIKEMLEEEEFDMLMKGFKKHLAHRDRQKVEEAGHPVNSEPWKEAFNKYLDADVYDTIKIKVESLSSGRECVEPAPIWCPYKKEHEEMSNGKIQ